MKKNIVFKHENIMPYDNNILHFKKNGIQHM